MERSRALRIGMAVAALVVVAVLILVGWAFSRPHGGAGTASAGNPLASSETAPDPSAEDPEHLPGAQEARGTEDASPTAETPAPEPAGQTADEKTLEKINEGQGLVTARVEDEQDPLVTGARFLRSLRTTDTTSDDVSDWYDARSSFLAEDQKGQQTDWGEAGDKEAVSRAEISWAEMDSAIEEGRGIAPDFAYGGAAEPGTHLVQVGMRLDRQLTAGEETIDTPSGALMEAVVVCPPTEGVDRCVVTRWAEEPSEFTAVTADSWEVGR